MMTKFNPPATNKGTAVAATISKKSGTFLAQLRAAKAPAPAVMPRPDRASLIAAALVPSQRPRLVLAVDATASREPAWEAAKQVTDALFSALPGQLDVALAVHGGSTVHTFTDFVSDASVLRDRAASVRCRSGQTRLLDILTRVREEDGVKAIIYVGDAFEESSAAAFMVADALRMRGTRLVVLHDAASGGDRDARVFSQIAERTGGCVLPFDAEAPDRLREVLEAVAVLAVGGIRLLEAKVKALPAARLLLENLSGK